MKKPLIVIVSTREALEVAVSSDLSMIPIDHVLGAEPGASMVPVMESRSFVPEDTFDSRGTVFLRSPEHESRIKKFE